MTTGTLEAVRLSNSAAVRGSESEPSRDKHGGGNRERLFDLVRIGRGSLPHLDARLSDTPAG